MREVVPQTNMMRRRRMSSSCCRRIILLIGHLWLLLLLTWLEGVPLTPSLAHVQPHPLEDAICQHPAFSGDGNPFPFSLCPGPFPIGGNCVWWAWEQWHLLGYDLPLTWGNAADWIVDAERAGLPVGTLPRSGAIAVFPVADGVWAYGPH